MVFNTQSKQEAFKPNKSLLSEIREQEAKDNDSNSDPKVLEEELEMLLNAAENSLPEK